MSFRIQCPCGTMISLQAEHLGQVVHCPKCQQPMSVRAPVDDAPPPAAIPVRPKARPVAPPVAPPIAQPVHPISPPPVSPNQPATARPYQPERPAPSDGESYRLQPMNDLPPRRAVLQPGREENPTAVRRQYRPKKKSGNGWIMATIGFFLFFLLMGAVIVALPAIKLAIENKDNPAKEVFTPEPVVVLESDATPGQISDVIRSTIPLITVRTNRGIKTGSGVFISEEGHIMTNMNLVQHATSIEIVSDGHSTEAIGFCYADSINDLAVIKIEPRSIPVQPIAVATQDPVPNDRVIAFGNRALTQSIGLTGLYKETKTIEQMPARQIASKGFPIRSNWMRSSAVCTAGYFGGPLVDSRGRLLGINTWTLPDATFSVPLDEILRVVALTHTAEIASLADLPVSNLEEFSGIPARDDGLPSFPTDPTPSVPRGDVLVNRSGAGNTPDMGRQSRDNRKNGRDETETNEPKDTTGAGAIELAADDQAFKVDDDPAVMKSFDTGGEAIVNLSISDDNRFLAAISQTGIVYVFDYVRGNLLYQIESKAPIRKTTFSIDPCYLCTASDLGLPSVHFRTPATGESEFSIRKTGYGSPFSLSVSPDALSVFCNWGRAPRRDGTRFKDFMDRGIKFWKADSIGEKFISKDAFPAYGGKSEIERRVSVTSKMSTDGSVLALGFDDGFVSLSSFNDGKIKLISARQIHTKPVTHLAISSNGKSLVSATEDGQLFFADLEKKTLNKTELGDQRNNCYGVAYSNAGRFVAASRRGKKIELYDIGSLTLARTIKTPSETKAIVFVNASQLIAGGDDGVIRVLDLP